MITFVWLTGAAVIGVLAAWLAPHLRSGNGFGLVGDTLASVLGAVVLGYVLRIAGLNLGGLVGRLIASFIGAAIVLFIVHVFTDRRTGQRSWS